MSYRWSDGTVGVEYELQLVDAATMDLVDGAPALLERFEGSPYVKPEYVQSTIEVITPVCERIEGVERALRSLVGQVWQVCEGLGMWMCGAGTHPFCRRFVPVTPLPRYQRTAAESGILAGGQVTLALQVHVGVRSAREAIVAMQGLHSLLPMLLAVSASSPFWLGYDTGYASWRNRMLAVNRTYGPPPRFETWSDVEALFETARRTQLLESWRDIHWDVRPRPDFGTIEVRVMDSVPTITEAAALAAFVRALTIYLIRTPPSRRPRALAHPLPRWLERDNEFRCSRLALDAQWVADPQGHTIHPLHEIVGATVEAVAPVARELGDADYLAFFAAHMMGNPSHARQRRVFAQTGSTREVVASLVQELGSELAETIHEWRGDIVASP